MIMFKTDLILKTRSPGHRDKGTWVEGDETPIPFKGDPQPASGKMMELLPEGKRNTETITVFAPIAMEFTPADEQQQRNGDLIEYRGVDYEVQVARRFGGSLLPHWELVAIKVKGGEK